MGRTAEARRCVIRYFPSRSTTAATTRMVLGGGLIVDSGARVLERDTEELLAHEQHVAGLELGLLAETDERSVRAAEVDQHDLAPLVRQPAVKARHVPVLGEEDVAALAAQLDTRRRDGKGVPGGVATDDER